MLKIHVRRIAPATLTVSPADRMRVLVLGEGYRVKAASEVAVGDILEAQGVVTKVECEGSRRAA